MLLSEVIEKLNDVLDKQGDGTFVVSVPERDSFDISFYIEGESYQGNYVGLRLGKKPYVFLEVVGDGSKE